MLHILLLVSITALTVAAAILSSNSKVYFNSRYKKKPWKGLTRKFWTVVPMYFMILILTIAQFLVNKREMEQEKLNAENASKIRDSTLRAQYESRSLQLSAQHDSSLLEMKRKFDSSQNVTTVLIADNLGKYGYKLDSTGNVLKKVISDSAKTRIIDQPDPTLTLHKVINKFEQNGERHFEVGFVSLSAGSTNFKLKVHLFSQDSVGRGRFIKSIDLLTSDLRIDPNIELYRPLSIPSDLNTHTIGIYLDGSYTNLDGSKIVPINDFYYYRLKTGNIGLMTGKSKAAAISTIPSKK